MTPCGGKSTLGKTNWKRRDTHLASKSPPSKKDLANKKNLLNATLGDIFVDCSNRQNVVYW